MMIEIPEQRNEGTKSTNAIEKCWYYIYIRISRKVHPNSNNVEDASSQRQEIPPHDVTKDIMKKGQLFQLVVMVEEESSSKNRFDIEKATNDRE